MVVLAEALVLLVVRNTALSRLVASLWLDFAVAEQDTADRNVAEMASLARFDDFADPDAE